MYTLEKYIKQKDYEAAKSGARQLIEKSTCIFFANTEREFYVDARGTREFIRS
jgi:hypothetical protein